MIHTHQQQQILYSYLIVGVFYQWVTCCLLTCFLLCFLLLVEGSQGPASPDCLASVMGSVGLKGVDLREDGSELAAKLFSLLTGDWILRL